MKYLIVGAGRIGQAVAYDLTANPGNSVRVIDPNEATLRAMHPLENLITTTGAAGRAGFNDIVRGHDVLVNTTDGSGCMELLNSAIQTGTPYIDVFGTLLVQERLDRSDAAREAGVSCMIGLGCSPGLANMTAAYLARQVVGPVDVGIQYVTLRPINGSPGLLSTVVRQYISDVLAPVLKDGAMEWVPPFSGRITTTFPDVGEVDLVCTPHSEPITLSKFTQNVRNASVRGTYPMQVMSLLKSLDDFKLLDRDLELEIGNERVPFFEILKTAIAFDGKLKPEGISPKYMLRVIVSGSEHSDEPQIRTFTHPDDWELPQAQMTALPTSYVAQLLANKEIPDSGVFGPELLTDAQVETCFEYLAARGIESTSGLGVR